MFTGLVQEVGTLERVERRGAGALVHVACGFSGFVLGESVCVCGACLSLTQFGSGGFLAFASEETLSRTGLSERVPGSLVNLERALRMGDPLGGHLVTGHVDARVCLLERMESGQAQRLRWSLPEGELATQIASKGSVALDGVSLTVNEVAHRWFDTMIIPITLSSTTLGRLKIGDFACLETDVLAKYVARRLGGDGARAGLSLELLARAGF
ncbi:MAG: riboflavin synthase [Myxococcota bacterium]|nr:riboflavin synthase [Myxococcota bacterium]